MCETLKTVLNHLPARRPADRADVRNRLFTFSVGVTAVARARSIFRRAPEGGSPEHAARWTRGPTNATGACPTTRSLNVRRRRRRRRAPV